MFMILIILYRKRNYSSRKKPLLAAACGRFIISIVASVFSGARNWSLICPTMVAELVFVCVGIVRDFLGFEFTINFDHAHSDLYLLIYLFILVSDGHFR